MKREPATPTAASAFVDERIDEPGWIQPHGILAATAADTHTVQCISENVESVLGIPAHELCDSPLTGLLDSADRKAFARALNASQVGDPQARVVTLAGRNGKRLRVEATVSRCEGGGTIVEFEPHEDGIDLTGYTPAHGPIQRLQSAPDIATLLADAARDLRTMTNFDRVIVYRFNAQGSADVVAESALPGAPSVPIGNRLAATDVTERSRRAYLRNPLRMIPDTQYRPVRLIAAPGWTPATPIDLSGAALRDVAPSYLDYLQTIGSRAALTLSIIVGERLWGLIACHHHAPLALGNGKRAVCRLVSELLGSQLERRTKIERRNERTNGPLGSPNAHATARIKLQEAVAAALPSRAAVVRIILDFASDQTRADGSAIETFDGSDVVFEAASGMLAPYAGTRIPRAGSFSGASAERCASLVWAPPAGVTAQAERDLCRQAGIASMLAIPIVISQATTIVLTVVSAQPNAFDEGDMRTLELAAPNFSSALWAAQQSAGLAAAEREQRTYARQLRALHAIASTTTSNGQDQIDAALQLGLEQLDLNWAFLGVIDYATHELVIENSVSREDDLIIGRGVRTPLDQTVIGISLTKDVRIVEDVCALPNPPAYHGWSSYIGVPLFINGRNYGAIGFTSRAVRPQPFSQENIEFLAVAGELIGSAVERSLQREQVETSATRYRALTEAIPQMVWVIDAASTFEYVNARWTDYTGLTLEASRETGHARVYDADGLAAVGAGRLAVPPHEYDCEVRLRRADGTYRWHLVRSVPFRDSAGDPGKWLVTATDIEERKSAEALMAGVHEAALAATEAKSRFLATMSHEIRTPMNAVIGMTELLLLTQLSGEQREYIEIVRDSGQSLLRVLNDILDYSKIEAGKLELENVDFDLGGQIESVVELLRAQYQIKGVELDARIASGVPAVVCGDPGRLRQVLLNLAGNALKFTPPGGNVHIDVAATRQDGETIPIHFTVEDTGIGIPPAVVARLFQPFSQGDESTTRKYGGTGLGLSICAQLVALMNGTIGVNSTAGAGSAFWFAIPMRPIRQSAKAADGRKRGPARAKPVVMRGEKILLVEDNEINTYLALKQLQRLGFVVSAVNNGQQAVEAVQLERFDLVLMDCHMPEMDGFGATREIRNLEAGTSYHLPIVAMTADARTEDHQNCLLAGMDDYVSKPTSLDSLRAVLDRWLPTPDRRQNSRNGIGPADPTSKLGVAKLLELFDGDRAAVITLLSAAVGSIKADFARIENCLAGHEIAAAVEAAHRLKGTSASIRAPRLGEIAAAIERAGSEAGSGIAPALLEELREAVDALILDVERQSKILETIE